MMYLHILYHMTSLRDLKERKKETKIVAENFLIILLPGKRQTLEWDRQGQLHHINTRVLNMARLVNILILFQIASKYIYFTIQMRNCDLLIFSYYGCSKSRGRRE